ncbi:WD-repeat-containing protein [Sistotremastrum niveocremeum HHB9708]|uniref:WD-repeat-containing protein n=2 Tax=Sistotremastraceae TaxID=3402574 RepID=A0A164ZJJ8_9AGAM|nr:WD-repeat-containing protein [Sistotremastrum niveocremeum HHB9708]KZT42908.1 WD40 repeat-like protein [Sistotremastrum suecicum HHB10207 ss-3]
MVKSYLRHGPTQAFGLICSSGSNSVFDGKLAYVPALEDVLVWDVKKGEMLAMWHDTGHRAEVTCIVRSPVADSTTFAVGYADGSIRIWNAEAGTVIVRFNGHKRAVTALAFDPSGHRLASGSMDTDLIIWDVIAEEGVKRLSGHRDQITGLRFISGKSEEPSSSALHSNYIISSSKDTFLKVWDLTTWHCIETVTSHRSEIWSFDINAAEDWLITGGSDGEVKGWKINHERLRSGLTSVEEDVSSKIIVLSETIPLNSQHRVPQISFHHSQPYLAIQSHERSVEIFRIRSEEEVQRKKLRRKKREKEKLDKTKDAKQDVLNGGVEPEDDSDTPVRLIDLLTPYLVVRSSSKIRSFDFGSDAATSKGATIFLALNSNALEVFNIPTPPKKIDPESPPEASRSHSLELPGHRSDIRSLCLNSDDSLLASASNGEVKIWNMKTFACIRTMECGYAICSTFLPGDRHVLIGTKSGHLLLHDIFTGNELESIQAHSGAVWSLSVRPDDQCIASGSADKEVKFWDIHRTRSDRTAGTVSSVSLVHSKTLKTSDDVLAVCYSPNGKLLAVSLLDSTVKIFYQDSLKFFLSLYGHKLPVLSMDISFDSKLLVTCSADKNVKIWGLDFGDCHKSIFAHDESIMQVAFEAQSHYFWTVGKDKMVKYWDGDKFENIQRLEGHHGEIWALALSHSGKFVVTGSHDKSIRIWEKLDDPLFLEEEREQQLEGIFEGGIADSLNRSNRLEDSPNGEGQPEKEANAVGKQTSDTLMSGEKIIEALEIADEERDTFQDYKDACSRLSQAEADRLPRPQKHAVLAAYDMEPSAYVLSVIEKITAANLPDALLILPFSKVISLLIYLGDWAEKRQNILLTSRVLFFLLKTHHHQIVANRIMRTSLLRIRRHLREALLQQKGTLSYNLAALKFIRRQQETSQLATFYEEEGLDEEKVRARIEASRQGKRKRVQI